MAGNTGPRTSDKKFFTELIDASLPGLQEIPEAVKKENFGEARRLFASYVRSALKPEYFNNMPYCLLQDTVIFPGETWHQGADRICNNLLISCGTEFQFGDKIDYFANPTFNNYKEWTWQLSRHSEWFILGYAYLQTKDEKYANTFAKQFDTWVKQALSPEPKSADGGETLCWRTIEAGIRMGSTWQYSLHAFYKSPVFTDDMITDWYKSVWEHGERLFNDHRSGNWLMMEMDGLAQIGILYPVLKDSGRWYNFAVVTLEKQLDIQFYPDGMQYELTTHYHGVSVSCYTRLMRVMRAYGIKLPGSFIKKLENTVAFYSKLIMPDFSLPNLNDGTWEKAKKYVGEYIEFFPNRDDFKWVITEGKEGKQPPYTSIALDWSGIMIMRTTWDRDAMWGLLDAGPFGKGHQHEDKLSLLLYMNGRRILTEGGVYAYDDSQIRRYILSTRSHNTIRVNGMDQNRRINYIWKDTDIKKESGMKYSINDTYDYVCGRYEEGYGPEAERSAVHERAVIFIKKPLVGSQPFFIVIDRLYGEKSNQYESLWHLDDESFKLDGLNASAAGINILTSGAEGMTANIITGQEEPEWQGWIANSGQQGDYRPIPTLIYQWNAGNSRTVTIFHPAAGNNCPIINVEASPLAENTVITFLLKNGDRISMDERDYR
ncbi:MAG: heparinase II/III family protein [Treponema sp.]|nr:heparinase II/III family protein [Treponema sp.]